MNPVAFRANSYQQPSLRRAFQQPKFRSGQPQDYGQQRMTQLAQQYPVIDRMFRMIDIPSSTPQDDLRHHKAVTESLNLIRALVIKSFRDMGVTDIEQNEHGSLIVRVPGSPGYENARPLMLTAHMDIVPGNLSNPTQPIKRTVKVMDGREFIATDGTTTLGADDKGGLAMILENVARLRNKPHIPLEIILSPDEESSCDSLKKLDTSKFKAKQVLVVDEFKAFNVTNGLASAVQVDVNVTGTNGGHSGDDINRPNRLNAITLMNRITNKLGTGVVALHPNYPNLPLISKNLGLVQGGSAPNAIPESASARYLLRSFDRNAQAQELARMEGVLRNFERRHKPTQPRLQIKMDWQEEYPPWQADPKSTLPPLCIDAAKRMNGPKVSVGPTHAAAQASILANKSNFYGEPFDAVLIGPNIEEAHTVRERIDWKSLVQVNEWLSNIIDLYTQQAR